MRNAGRLGQDTTRTSRRRCGGGMRGQRKRHERARSAYAKATLRGRPSRHENQYKAWLSRLFAWLIIGPWALVAVRGTGAAKCGIRRAMCPSWRIIPAPFGDHISMRSVGARAWLTGYRGVRIGDRTLLITSISPGRLESHNRHADTDDNRQPEGRRPKQQLLHPTRPPFSKDRPFIGPVFHKYFFANAVVRLGGNPEETKTMFPCSLIPTMVGKT
jgi:hypothetical protein